jgi:hypothetical protein
MRLAFGRRSGSIRFDPVPEREAFMEMTTLAEAVTHFSALGYRGSFRAEESGLREVFGRKIYPPGSPRIDDLLRFEGETDPGDQVVPFALREVGGEVLGTYVVAFGPQVDRFDAAAVLGLRGGRKETRAGGSARTPHGPGTS